MAQQRCKRYNNGRALDTARGGRLGAHSSGKTSRSSSTFGSATAR